MSESPFHWYAIGVKFSYNLLWVARNLHFAEFYFIELFLILIWKLISHLFSYSQHYRNGWYNESLILLWVFVCLCACDWKYIVGNPWVILIDSLYHQPWVNLETLFVLNQICMTYLTFLYPMKLHGSPSKFCSGLSGSCIHDKYKHRRYINQRWFWGNLRT